MKRVECLKLRGQEPCMHGQQTPSHGACCPHLNCRISSQHLISTGRIKWPCSSQWQHYIVLLFWIFAVKCYAVTELFRGLLRHLSQPPGTALLNGLEATGTRSYLCVDKCNDLKKEQQIVDYQTKHIKRIMKQSGDETASKDQAWDNCRTWEMSVQTGTYLKISRISSYVQNLTGQKL